MALESGPVYRRIAERLRRAIAEGRLAPGAKLPSERELAARQGVSLMTARRALVELDREALVIRRVGAGTFVAPARGGVRKLRDPHEEFDAPDCVVVAGKDAEWVREWRSGRLLVAEERVTFPGAVDGPLGTRPLLDFLGESGLYASEEMWAEGDRLRVRQTIFGLGKEAVAVRELAVRGRQMQGWVAR